MMKVVVSKDEKRVNFIRRQLEENGGYCPCRLIKNEDTKCICEEFRAAIASGTPGKCHCGLYEIVADEK